MKCAEVMELMQRELDGDLEMQEEESLSNHLSTCHDCRILHEKLKDFSSQLERLPKVEPAFSIVDQILPTLEEIDRENENSLTHQQIKGENKGFTFHKNKKFWIPGMAFAAAIFITLFLNNPLIELNLENRLALDQAEQGEIALSGESNDEEMHIFREESMSEVELDHGDREHQEAGHLPEEREKYPSPDGVYTAFIGLGGEDIRIDKGDEPYLMSKHLWEKPWEVAHIEWVANDKLYYVLYNADNEQRTFWLLDTAERTETQLEWPYQERE